MTNQKLADVFLYEYKKPGGMHWTFNGLRDCVEKWQRWGITGLPNPSPEAIDLLRPHIEADDAFLASIRA